MEKIKIFYNCTSEICVTRELKIYMEKSCDRHISDQQLLDWEILVQQMVFGINNSGKRI